MKRVAAPSLPSSAFLAFLTLTAFLAAPAGIADTVPDGPKKPAADKPTAAEAVARREATYQDIVARAKAGESIDYQALRSAWLALRIPLPPARESQLPRLQTRVMDAVSRKDAGGVALASTALLDVDYTDLTAHRLRMKACMELEDKSCTRSSVLAIQGLTASIYGTGDGRSCATAWNAVSREEVRFVGSLHLKEARIRGLVRRGERVCLVVDGLEYDPRSTPSSRAFDVTEMDRQERALAMMQKMEEAQRTGSKSIEWDSGSDIPDEAASLPPVASQSPPQPASSDRTPLPPRR